MFQPLDLSPAERLATTNCAAFRHWLRAVHGVALDPGERPLRAWAQADGIAAASFVLQFAGPGFSSARLAAGLLLQADLRPDDRIRLLGSEPDWLPLALAATRGRSEPATVLITGHQPGTLPPNLRRVILLGGAPAAFPPEVTVSRPEEWTYPRESSAD